MREHCMLGKVARCDECGGVCKPDIVCECSASGLGLSASLQLHFEGDY